MFVTEYEPPEKRRSFVEGGIEMRITEAAVMLAFAFHLLELAGGTGTVSMHPDGEHAKTFDIVAFLERRGFARIEPIGRTAYGGRYVRGEEEIVVNPTSGVGDVVGIVDGQRIVAECKGGTINTKHSGQKSRLRKGLCELIGQLMWQPMDGSRQIAVLPETEETDRLASRLISRCAQAGIEIALVDNLGKIRYVQPQA